MKALLSIFGLYFFSLSPASPFFQMSKLPWADILKSTITEPKTNEAEKTITKGVSALETRSIAYAEIKAAHKNADWKSARMRAFDFVQQQEIIDQDFKQVYYILAKSSFNDADYASALKYYDQLLMLGLDTEMKQISQYEFALVMIAVHKPLAKKLFAKMANNDRHEYQQEAKGVLANMN